MSNHDTGTKMDNDEYTDADLNCLGKPMGNKLKNIAIIILSLISSVFIFMYVIDKISTYDNQRLIEEQNNLNIEKTLPDRWRICYNSIKSLSGDKTKLDALEYFLKNNTKPTRNINESHLKLFTNLFDKDDYKAACFGMLIAHVETGETQQ
jgi:hypothetical protein